jgi:hypothetical protein
MFKSIYKQKIYACTWEKSGEYYFLPLGLVSKALEAIWDAGVS